MREAALQGKQATVWETLHAFAKEALQLSVIQDINIKKGESAGIEGGQVLLDCVAGHAGLGSDEKSAAPLAVHSQNLSYVTHAGRSVSHTPEVLFTPKVWLPLQHACLARWSAWSGIPWSLSRGTSGQYMRILKLRPHIY